MNTRRLQLKRSIEDAIPFSFNYTAHLVCADVKFHVTLKSQTVENHFLDLVRNGLRDSPSSKLDSAKFYCYQLRPSKEVGYGSGPVQGAKLKLLDQRLGHLPAAFLL